MGSWQWERTGALKVLTISATDRVGGAGIAAYRLHRGLLAAGIDAEMLVWRKVTNDATVHRLSGRLNPWGRVRRRVSAERHRRQLASSPRQHSGSYWSVNLGDWPAADVINSFAPDIAHVHWVGDGYLPIPQLSRMRAPIVWTLHDMWAFTGGCHYAGNCRRYRESCGSCPQLRYASENDISARVCREKRRAWADAPMTVVCPSRWLADCVSRSAVLGNKRIEVIGNPIDASEFKPLDQREARRAFNLPRDKKLVLFGAMGGAEDPRKGFAYLREALNGLADSGLELVMFGSDKTEALAHSLPVHQLGVLRDAVSLNLLYAACDVFALPSLEDNLPNTLLEALACGRPCVAFDVGGISDLLRHRENGYLARDGDSEDMRKGIAWALAHEWNPSRIHEQTIEGFGANLISERYIALYRSLLDEIS